MAPLSIAVIIPVGPGHRAHALRAIHSVRKQSIAARFIVVDDTGGGLWPDLEIGRNLIFTYGPRGVGFARRLGTMAADQQGYDMVCYLDADDILLPRALEAMLRTLAARPACYVYGDGYNLRGGKASYYRAAEYDPAIYGRQNIHNVTALMPMAVALAGEWTNRHWEDYLFYCSLALRGLCGVRAPYPVIAYDMAAGYRREMATNEGSGYANGLAAEYRQKYLSSGGATMGCCGSSGPQGGAVAAMVEAAPGVPQPDGTVAMAYSGNAAAGVPYNINGRRYTGKVGGVVYAHPDDVARLEQIGVFYQVPATPDGAEVIALAEEYNALVLGSPTLNTNNLLPGKYMIGGELVEIPPPGALDFKPLELSARDQEFTDQMALWADGRRRDQDAALSRVLASNPALAELPADELAQHVETMQRHMAENPDDDSAEDDDAEPDASDPPAEAPAKPKRGRKPAAKS